MHILGNNKKILTQLITFSALLPDGKLKLKKARRCTHQYILVLTNDFVKTLLIGRVFSPLGNRCHRYLSFKEGQ